MNIFIRKEAGHLTRLSSLPIPGEELGYPSPKTLTDQGPSDENNYRIKNST